LTGQLSEINDTRDYEEEENGRKLKDGEKKKIK
jgi:hypothetical protein